MSGLDLGFEQTQLGAEEDVFGLQQDYRDKIEGRLIDLLRAQVDLDPYKLDRTGSYEVGEQDKKTGMIWDGQSWVHPNDYQGNQG